MTDRGRVTVVGLGDDGPPGLSPRARRAVSAAELLCGGRRHLALFPKHPAERIVVTGDLNGLVDRIEGEIGRRRVVVLASGDPCFYGVGPILARRLGRDRVEIIPGVGAVALAFARLGESWHDATVVSAHGRRLDDAIRQARGASKLLVLTDETNTPAAAARALLQAGAEDAPAWVFEHLGGRGEREIPGTLGEVATGRFAALNVLVVPELRWPEPDRRFGRPESDFLHQRGMITKAEVRAISLSKLALRPDAVVWDVGAGCGSVAIEAAGLVPRGRVFAIERSAEQVELLRENVGRRGQEEIVGIVQGSAPAALEPLPAPDAVFIGGSGGALEPILDCCLDRLAPGGRIVVNLATVENLARCTLWARRRRLAHETVQVSVARGSGVAGMTRLAAQNPIFVVTIETRGYVSCHPERSEGSHADEHEILRSAQDDRKGAQDDNSLDPRSSPLDPQPGSLIGVGLGPGDPELITVKGLFALQEADVVFAPVRRRGERSLALAIADGMIDHQRQEVITLAFPDRPGADWEQQCRTIVATLRGGRRGVFLTEGDPSFFSTFGHVVKALRTVEPGLTVEVVPGVSSVTAAAAAAGMSIAEQAERVAIVPAVHALETLPEVLRSFESVVLIKVGGVMRQTIDLLERHDLLDRAVYVRRCGWPEQTIIRDLRSLRDDPPRDYFSLIIVRRSVE